MDCPTGLGYDVPRSIEAVGDIRILIISGYVNKLEIRLPLTQGRDEVAPELGGLPGKEEEAEEPHDDGVDGLVGELGVDAADLGEVGGFRCPHGCRAEAKQNAGRHQGVEFRIELGADVRSVAQHGHAQGPFHGQPLDDEGGHEDAGEHQGRVYSRQGHGAQAVTCVYGRL